MGHYQDVLVKVSLLRDYVENMNMDISFHDSKNNLMRTLVALEEVLMSDKMIETMNGYKGHVEGEYFTFRMLRNYRNETRFPFAKKISSKKLKRSTDDGFPMCFSGFEDIWAEFLNRDQVHFNPESPSHPLNELRNFIEIKAIEAISKRVKSIYVSQGGILNSQGEIDFSRWRVESRAFVYTINRLSYKNVFQHLETIKFFRNKLKNNKVTNF